jgi:hypothetical protein
VVAMVENLMLNQVNPLIADFFLRLEPKLRFGQAGLFTALEACELPRPA